MPRTREIDIVGNGRIGNSLNTSPAVCCIINPFASVSEYIQVLAKLKKTNRRLRPYVQHPVLVAPLFTVGDFSYPSGHSSGSELQAHILGKLFPTRIDAFLTRAQQVADGRVVAGVHYASDAEAGIALGDLLFTELENKPEFENDLTAALTKDQISLK